MNRLQSTFQILYSFSLIFIGFLHALLIINPGLKHQKTLFFRKSSLECSAVGSFLYLRVSVQLTFSKRFFPEIPTYSPPITTYNRILNLFAIIPFPYQNVVSIWTGLQPLLKNSCLMNIWMNGYMLKYILTNYSCFYSILKGRQRNLAFKELVHRKS